MNITSFVLGSAALALAIPGTARPRVRIIAVQVKVSTGMYRDLPTFRAAMDADISEAAKRKAHSCPTLVALPEDIGLGLVFLGQWDTVKDAKTIRDAGGKLGARYAPDVMANAMRFGASPNRALLLTANDMWLRKAFFDTFGALAAKYKIFLAAGSAPISLPNSGEVRNVAVLFGPTGRILGQWAKVHLIDLEGPSGLDLVPGKIDDLKVVDTPFGKVGTAVCYDGFHDDVLDRLTGDGARIILQPSFNPQTWSPEQEADWATGLWQRLKTRPGVVGVNPMAVGNLFDIICEGETNIVGAEAPPNGYYARVKSPTEPALVLVDVP